MRAHKIYKAAESQEAGKLLSGLWKWLPALVQLLAVHGSPWYHRLGVVGDACWEQDAQLVGIRHPFALQHVRIKVCILLPWDTGTACRPAKSWASGGTPMLGSGWGVPTSKTSMS